MKRCYLVVLAMLALGLAQPAAAQFIYMDTNQDGACGSDDVLYSEITSVDIYLATDRNADGSAAACPTGEDLTLGSYSFILRSTGSNLEYGAWTDNLGYTTGLTDTGPRMQGGNDLWIALGNGPTFPPGTHKLGTLAVTIARGVPFLAIVASSSLSPHAVTSFASACDGSDGDNTMRLGVDFFDACAISFVSAVTESTWGKIKAAYR